MTSGESPAVARRRLRLALRKAREAKGLTQGQVADSLDWSLSKVNRIENGDVTVSGTDLRALVQLLSITDQARIQRMTEDARASRRRGWWDEPRYREHLTPGTLQLLQFESEATAIRQFQPSLMPGLLQTSAYATVVLNSPAAVEELSEEAREARLAIRNRRGEQVLGRPDPPDYFVILDESVLLRYVGGPQVTVEQLETLLRLMEQRRVMIRILSLVDAAPWIMLGQYQILDLGDEENAVLYRELTFTDEIEHTSARVRVYRRRFEQMWQQSLSVEASARLIEARAAAVRSELDRLPSPRG